MANGHTRRRAVSEAAAGPSRSASGSGLEAVEPLTPIPESPATPPASPSGAATPAGSMTPAGPLAPADPVTPAPLRLRIPPRPRSSAPTTPAPSPARRRRRSSSMRLPSALGQPFGGVPTPAAADSSFTRHVLASAPQDVQDAYWAHRRLLDQALLENVAGPPGEFLVPLCIGRRRIRPPPAPWPIALMAHCPHGPRPHGVRPHGPSLPSWLTCSTQVHTRRCPNRHPLPLPSPRRSTPCYPPRGGWPLRAMISPHRRAC
ncbi:hypothetical protein B0H21DRAFT_152406 [Amylocystis lapponica]|nr:hypothetical protein B0H21DRAFT_152406 [Amylocystis lapponica]